MGKLVLTVSGSRFPDSVYRRFFGSLRGTNFRDEAVLFIFKDSLSSEIEEVCREFHVRTVVFEKLEYHIQSYRYRLYQDYLSQKSLSDSVSFVFHSDLRDVLFQRNPFEYPGLVANDLVLFSEKQKIGICPYNSRWVKDLFGEEVLLRLADQTVICSGTTCGTSRAFRLYLAEMNSVFQSRCNADLINQRGIDQGVHNYLFYEKMLGNNVRVLTNETGPVNTIGYAQKLANQSGEVLNEDGEVSYVVHQLDRMAGTDAWELVKSQCGYPLDDLEPGKC